MEPSYPTIFLVINGIYTTGVVKKCYPRQFLRDHIFPVSLPYKEQKRERRDFLAVPARIAPIASHVFYDVLWHFRGIPLASPDYVGNPQKQRPCEGKYARNKNGIGPE